MARGEFLREGAGDPDLASCVMRGCRSADMDAVARAMPDFAAKLTRGPTAMRCADVERLRGHGLTDEQILSVTLIACLFNFMTRLADGLGVEAPEGKQARVEGWLTGGAWEQGRRAKVGGDRG